MAAASSLMCRWYGEKLMYGHLLLDDEDGAEHDVPNQAVRWCAVLTQPSAVVSVFVAAQDPVYALAGHLFV